MVANVTKISQEDEKQKLVQYRKKILYNEKKRLLVIINYKFKFKELKIIN